MVGRGAMQALPPQAVRQHLRSPLQLSSALHVTAHNPTASGPGVGHWPGLDFADTHVQRDMYPDRD